jgi:dTDP-4-dehydrorhamnose reductase
MIWLIGNKGMLGTELAGALASAGIEFVGTDREVSILDPEALAASAAGKDFSWIVNCAAYTAVDKAEEEPELARRLNAEGPENLARLSRAIGARLVHLSTDYVFDGSGSRPYREEDPVAPLGVYGRTKAEGEERLRAVAPDSIILRTAWLYGRHGPNFVVTMLRLMKENEEIGVVADQRGSPTWARDLAAAIVAILRSGSASAGVYHFTNSGETNWHEFALEIERRGRELGLLARPCRVKALRTDQYPTKTRRPAYSVLAKEKIGRVFGIQPPEWRESLAKFLGEIAQV